MELTIEWGKCPLCAEAWTREDAFKSLKDDVARNALVAHRKRSLLAASKTQLPNSMQQVQMMQLKEQLKKKQVECQSERRVLAARADVINRFKALVRAGDPRVLELNLEAEIQRSIDEFQPGRRNPPLIPRDGGRWEEVPPEWLEQGAGAGGEQQHEGW